MSCQIGGRRKKMTKRKNNNKIIGIVAFCLVVAVVAVMSAGAIAKAFNIGSPVTFGNVENVNINVSGTGDDGGMLGGSTSDNWNVGGNLSVTGTSAFTGAVSMSGNITSATGVIISDGYFDGTNAIASPTLESLGVELNATCSGTDVGGCDDGTYIVGSRFIMTNSDSLAAEREATTTCETRVYFDDTASSSQEVSYEIWCVSDNGAAVSKWMELDSANLLLPSGVLGVGTSSISNTLTVDKQTATTTALFGSPSSSACLRFYAGADQTLYYFDPTATTATNMATTTQPGWCS